MLINVTRSSMPTFEEYCEEIKELWDSRWLTNMGVKHRQLEAELKQSTQDVTSLIIDMENLAYISSAGLRVLLSAQKLMNRQGNMIIRKVNDTVMEVFEITGFVDILTIQ